MGGATRSGGGPRHAASARGALRAAHMCFYAPPSPAGDEPNLFAVKSDHLDGPERDCPKAGSDFLRNEAQRPQTPVRAGRPRSMGWSTWDPPASPQINSVLPPHAGASAPPAHGHPGPRASHRAHPAGAGPRTGGDRVATRTPVEHHERTSVRAGRPGPEILAFRRNTALFAT